MRDRVEAALEECRALGGGLEEAYVFEAYRSQELQGVYYARGRTVIPPEKPVTWAPDNLHSWHGYGLAVDVIHRRLWWGAGDAWFARVAEVFKRHGLRWGGDWVKRDLPHFQWGQCKASPSDEARRLVKEQGVEAVWRAVGAAA